MSPSLKGLFIGRRKTEAMRIESVLESTLNSPLAPERKRMERRIISHAKVEPQEMVPILLKYYQSEKARVRESLERCLTEIASSREGLEAIIHSLRNPSRMVRRSVFSFLSKNRTFHAVTYASFYEQTMILLAMAREKGIPVEDIEALAEVSRDTYLDGEVLQAVRDIATCLDLVKHRYRSVEHLKSYVVDVLRLAPDLVRMGVYSGRIEEPLRKALKVSKERRYDETSDLISLRMNEAKVRKELEQLGQLVKENVGSAPEMELAEVKGTEVWVLSRLGELMSLVTSSTIAGNRGDAIDRLGMFLEEFSGYLDEAATRLREGDTSALFTLYITGVVCLKLLSYHLPTSAEDIYQRCFREYEGEPSIHVVRWPDIVMPSAV